MQAAAVVAALQNEDSRMHPDSDRRAWPTWLGAPLLALLLAAGVRADDAPPMSVQHDVVFDGYSPLARTETLLGRVLTPLMLERIRLEATASGQAIAERSIDLAKERFALYVPSGAAPAAGYGLLVFVPPWEQAVIPAKWLPVLARHDLIVVTAAQSGNAASVVERRMPLALTGYENVRKRYPLDPARVYVGGFSGGSRVAQRLALAFPDVFRGALLNSSSDPIGTPLVPLPDAGLFRQFEERTRLVYATGSDDEAALGSDRHSRDSEQALCFTDIETFTMHGRAHVPADPSTLEHALDALDAPREAGAGLDACRARRDARIRQQLAEVEKLIAGRDLQGADKRLGEVDGQFGGLALPASLTFARELAAHGIISSAKP